MILSELCAVMMLQLAVDLSEVLVAPRLWKPTTNLLSPHFFSLSSSFVNSSFPCWIHFWWILSNCCLNGLLVNPFVLRLISASLAWVVRWLGWLLSFIALVLTFDKVVTTPTRFPSSNNATGSSEHLFDFGDLWFSLQNWFSFATL